MLPQFSTTLFVEGNEVKYNIFLQPTSGRHNFQPDSPEVGYYSAPSFWVYQAGKKWKFIGIINLEVEKQAIQKIIAFLDLNRSNELKPAAKSHLF